MRERPILFSGPMVRALLAGTKTQTRRVVKPQPEDLGNGEARWAFAGGHSGPTEYLREIAARMWCPYGVYGDRLWVRETWRADAYRPEETIYRTDGPEEAADCVKWRPSIFMPRARSRLTLEVTGIRVERLQVISEFDAVAEGCEARPFPGPWWQGYRDMDGQLLHQQAIGDEPPDWMIEPKRMSDTKHLDRSAIDGYRAVWAGINGIASWEANPWVWVVEFRRDESLRSTEL